MTPIKAIGFCVVFLAIAAPAEAARPTKFQVLVNVSSGGQVTSLSGISCPSTCTTNVTNGSAISFTAVPDSGFSFVQWGDGCAAAGSSLTCSLVINSNTTVSATFQASGGGGGGGSTIEQLEDRIASLEASIAGLEEMLAGISRGTDQNSGQDTLFFDGMNVAIRSGEGATDSTPNGRGNLIIGYNENDGDTQTGSHNLVLGKYQTYSSYGGIVAGADNTISGGYASVLGGGPGNVASSLWSSVLGGEYNIANGRANVVLGGERNQAIQRYSAIVGGTQNRTEEDALYSGIFYGAHSTIFGGAYNTVLGSASGGTILGGYQNTVGGKNVVAGGDSVVCEDELSRPPGTGVRESQLCSEGVVSPVD